MPILPNTFILKMRQVKDTKGYKDDSGAVKQINIIKNVFNQCDRIIVATDAGREGELIFRYIYEYIGCTKPFDRLWISSLTEKAIKEGLQNLKDGKSYDRLYYAAKARSEADCCDLTSHAWFFCNYCCCHNFLKLDLVVYIRICTHYLLIPLDFLGSSCFSCF